MTGSSRWFPPPERAGGKGANRWRGTPNSSGSRVTRRQTGWYRGGRLRPWDEGGWSISREGMTVKASEVIWFNGEIVPWEAARVHVLAHALHYGSSVFEGIRTYATPPGPAVFCLDDPLRRLYDSCRITRMTPPYAPEALRDAILTA